ncbi:Surfeit locus protein 6 containing protein [Brugia malayi]|uniref:Bm7494 n=1 Tax=Brugia malayi TaxID=6279 RepID=A0A0J9Y5S1_BRUMA|nr:Surfeit locus protein 6 containing protein [Brugia malayi]CDQ02937.2 Bm7494 [Brugia malayi]VIO88233.1 Surfeit locus protein 6 containing protein [Brugia malayi]
MLLKEDREKLLEKCIQIDKIIKRNINLIPIGNWHFDDETTEELRKQKHRIVDEQLTGEQKQKLSKASKQRIAREIGVNCQTISDVLDWMAKNHGNTKPVKPVTIPKMKDRKKNKDIKPVINNSVDSQPLDTNGSTKPLARELNGSLVNETTSANNERKRIHDSNMSNTENNSFLGTISTVAPPDALEGRKLALKKLQEKLEQFKAKRRGNMTAYQYEEKRKLKRRMSKLKMKERRTVAKQQIKNSKLPSDETVPNKRPKLGTESKVGEMEEKDDKLIFSKFDFIVRDEKQRKTKKDKRDKFTGKDYKRLLVKAEKREEKLEKVRSKNPEKALRIEKNIQWKKALNRAEGQKVKDNPELLKKSLKKKEKIKESRRKKWGNRVKHTLQMQARKQEKRSANIQARKDIVKKRKMQRARKKGRIL